MKPKTRCLLAALLVGAAVVGGCGSSSQKTVTDGHTIPSAALLGGGSSTTQSLAPGAEQNSHRASIAVESAARLSSGAIASRYTCRGANISLPITWGGVHPPAKEVVVVVRTITGGLLSAGSHSAVAWEVGNISPSVTQIAAGQVPPGAVVGRNRFGQNGYSLCPPVSGKSTLVTIAVDAFTHKLGLKPGFEVASIAKAFAQPGVQWGSTLAGIPKHS